MDKKNKKTNLIKASEAINNCLIKYYSGSTNKHMIDNLNISDYSYPTRNDLFHKY